MIRFAICKNFEDKQIRRRSHSVETLLNVLGETAEQRP